MPGPVVFHQVNAVRRNDVRLGDGVAAGQGAALSPGDQRQPPVLRHLADTVRRDDLCGLVVGAGRVGFGLFGEMAEVVGYRVQVRGGRGGLCWVACAPGRAQVGLQPAPVGSLELELLAVAQQVGPLGGLVWLIQVPGECEEALGLRRAAPFGLLFVSHAAPPLGRRAPARRPEATLRRTSPGSRPMRYAASSSAAAVLSPSSIPAPTSCPRANALRFSVSFRVPSGASRRLPSCRRRAPMA